MILLPLLLQPLQTETFDFYLQSVKKGKANVRQDGDTLYLESSPGFGEASSLQIHLNAATPSDATFQSKSAGRITYALNVTPDANAPATGAKAIGKASLFSPLQPGLLPYLLAEYDLKKGGFQTLPATDLAKGNPREINAELFRTTERRLGGHLETLREWRLESPPTAEAIIWTTPANQPLAWWVPAQNFEIVRRGYEELRPSAKYEKRVSPPRFAAKVEKDVWVPMRDGVRLMADVYRPDSAARFPVILQRSCYDRSEFGNADGEFYAQRGYVYVTEHTRGRGGSEGVFEPERHEAVDGYDTIAWCGTQPWSSGKVGMIGASYNGFCAWMAAKTQPRWLKTMISVVPMPGPPDGAPWTGGTHYVGATLQWYGLLRDKAKVQPYNDDITAATNTLPMSKADIVQFGHSVPQFLDEIRADRCDESVRKKSYREDIGKINMPVLYFDGWLDTVAVATKLNYSQMVAHGARNQKLIWGPWNHFTNRESRDGATDFTPDGYLDMRTISLRWFDRWLKGNMNGIDKEPAVAQFLLGENRWVQSAVWPPKSVHSQRWYLQAGKGFAPRLPKKPGSASRYTYDPAKFVCKPSFASSYFFDKGYDAADVCRHEGQLLFDSPVLRKPLTLDGPIRGKIFASTSAKDTDWAMTLIDLHPDGVAVPLQSGLIRARYRKSYAKPELLKPGEVYGYDLDMWQIGITIPAGHRLRVAVCSTLFPDTDRNLNTGEPVADATRMVVAKQTIYHDPNRASYVELPVLRGIGF